MVTPWAPTTPSGSRASPRYSPWDEGDAMAMDYETRDDGFDHDEEDDADHYAFLGNHSMMNTGILPHGILMTPQIPPPFNGRISWFQYESMVKEWVDTCSIDVEKQGPMLKVMNYPGEPRTRHRRLA